MALMVAAPLEAVEMILMRLIVSDQSGIEVFGLQLWTIKLIDEGR
jgi:hypothetical protein